MAVLRDGNIKAAIWKNTSEKGPFYSITYSRSYTTDDGKTWEDSNGFVGSDNARLNMLIPRAYAKSLALREQDKAEAKFFTEVG